VKSKAGKPSASMAHRPRCPEPRRHGTSVSGWAASTSPHIDVSARCGTVNPAQSNLGGSGEAVGLPSSPQPARANTRMKRMHCAVTREHRRPSAGRDARSVCSATFLTHRSPKALDSPPRKIESAPTECTEITQQRHQDRNVAEHSATPIESTTALRIRGRHPLQPCHVKHLPIGAWRIDNGHFRPPSRFAILSRIGVPADCGADDRMAGTW
jgi:hypothetical protein